MTLQASEPLYKQGYKQGDRIIDCVNLRTGYVKGLHIVWHNQTRSFAIYGILTKGYENQSRGLV